MGEKPGGSSQTGASPTFDFLPIKHVASGILTVQEAVGMNEPATDWNRRKPVNVVDLGLQARVGKLVTEAMQSVVRAVFPTRDAAAKACARAIQPITNRHGAEAGALLLSLTGGGKGPTRAGSPVAGREDCRLSFPCGVIVQDGGRMPRGLLSGYVHSHPGSIGFSDNDLFVARSCRPSRDRRRK